MNVQPLPGMPDPPPVVRKKRALTTAETKPRWTSYKPARRVACEDCMADLVASGGSGPLSRAARWRRQHDGDDRVMCTEHANLRRRLDKLELLVDGGNVR